MSDEEMMLQRLCQAQIDGTATDEERANLGRLLESSEAARMTYLVQMDMHALLSWQHFPPPVTLPERSDGRKGRQALSWHWMAMTAVVLLLAGFLAWWQQMDFRSGTSFEVVASDDARYPVGKRVTLRKLDLKRGGMSFRLDSGAVVDVTAPVKLELISSMHMRVLHGAITADISEGAKGFIIETAQARIVDLGTRFSVTAQAISGTDVVVFEGKVEVFDPSGVVTQERPKITLTEGEAVRVGPSSSPKRLRMVPLHPDARSMRNGGRGKIVSSIRDNVEDDGFRGYYGLVRGGFGEGARAYTTGYTRTWHPMRGESFPAELAGADVICTFGRDGKEAGLEITLQINRPCDLYVMADARAVVPDWLQQEYVDTGYMLRSGPWISRTVPKEEHAQYFNQESAYVPYRVWKRRISGPGPVVLGSPLAQLSGKSPAMYGIAVKAIP